MAEQFTVTVSPNKSDIQQLDAFSVDLIVAGQARLVKATLEKHNGNANTRLEGTNTHIANSLKQLTVLSGNDLVKEREILEKYYETRDKIEFEQSQLKK